MHSYDITFWSTGMLCHFYRFRAPLIKACSWWACGGVRMFSSSPSLAEMAQFGTLSLAVAVSLYVSCLFSVVLGRYCFWTNRLDSVCICCSAGAKEQRNQLYQVWGRVQRFAQFSGNSFLSRFSGSEWVIGPGLSYILKIQVLGRQKWDGGRLYLGSSLFVRTPFFSGTPSPRDSVLTLHTFTVGSTRGAPTCLGLSPCQKVNW